MQFGVIKRIVVRRESPKGFCDKFIKFNTNYRARISANTFMFLYKVYSHKKDK